MLTSQRTPQLTLAGRIARPSGARRDEGVKHGQSTHSARTRRLVHDAVSPARLAPAGDACGRSRPRFRLAGQAPGADRGRVGLVELARRRRHRRRKQWRRDTPIPAMACGDQARRTITRGRTARDLAGSNPGHRSRGNQFSGRSGGGGGTVPRLSEPGGTTSDSRRGVPCCLSRRGASCHQRLVSRAGVVQRPGAFARSTRAGFEGNCHAIAGPGSNSEAGGGRRRPHTGRRARRPNRSAVLSAAAHTRPLTNHSGPGAGEAS